LPSSQPCSFSLARTISMAPLSSTPASDEVLRILHKTIDSVSQMTEDLRLNTAISQMMVFVNEMTGLQERPKAVLEDFLLLLAPYAPHMAEELWAKLGHEESLTYAAWPKCDEKYLVDDMVKLMVQVNGKLRDQAMVPAGVDESGAMDIVLASEKLQGWLEGKQVVKTIYVPGRLVNLVVR